MINATETDALIKKVTDFVALTAAQAEGDVKGTLALMFLSAGLLLNQATTPPGFKARNRTDDEIDDFLKGSSMHDLAMLCATFGVLLNRSDTGKG